MCCGAPALPGQEEYLLMLFLLFLHRRFRREKRRPHRSGPSFLLWNPRGRSPLVEPPLPIPFSAGQPPTSVSPSLRRRKEEHSPQRAPWPIAAVASPWLRPVARCQLITTGWSASAGFPRHLQGASHTSTFPQFLEVKEDGLDLAAARAPKKCCK
jgi:hypothetical protein